MYSMLSQSEEAQEAGLKDIYIKFMLQRKHTDAYKEMKAEQCRLFKEADANQDGLLNLDEYKVFRQKDYECTKATKGIALELEEYVFEQEYELMNKIT